MRVRMPLLLAIPLIAAASCAGGTATEQATAVTAVVGVDVIPMDAERVLRDQTVIVRDGVIAEIGDRGAVRLPADAARLDGSGRFLIPGLVDMHVHLRDSSELLSYLAYGVTSVVHMSGPMANLPDVVDLRRRVAAGEIPGPAVYTTGRMLDGDPPINPDVSVAVRTPQEARAAVEAQIEAGVDFIKVYNNLDEGALRAAVAAAHARGLGVFGHIPRAGGREQALQRALDAGLDVIAHGEEYFFTFFHGGVEDRLDAGEVPWIPPDRRSDAARLSRRAGVAVIPNLSFVAMTRAQLDDLSGVLADPEARFLRPEVLAMWKRRSPATRPDIDRFDRRERAKYQFVREFTAALSEAGVPLMVGTDASAPGLFPGKSAHLEIRELAGAGLTAYDALSAGTRVPAAFIASHRGGMAFGTITTGSRADAILLRGNPLEDIAHLSAIDGIFVRGRWLTSADLRALRDNARR